MYFYSDWDKLNEFYLRVRIHIHENKICKYQETVEDRSNSGNRSGCKCQEIGRIPKQNPTLSRDDASICLNIDFVLNN